MPNYRVVNKIKLLDRFYKITKNCASALRELSDVEMKLRLFKWNCRVVKNSRVVPRVNENLLDFSLYYELISKPFYSMTASTLPNYERH